MNRAGVIACLVLASCGTGPAMPNAQEKLDELLVETEEVSTGTEFESISGQLGHMCIRRRCSEFCQDDFDIDRSPDEILICIWDEHSGNVSVITFGSVYSIIALAEDEIVAKDIDVIYTGP